MDFLKKCIAKAKTAKPAIILNTEKISADLQNSNRRLMCVVARKIENGSVKKNSIFILAHITLQYRMDNFAIFAFPYNVNKIKAQ